MSAPWEQFAAAPAPDAAPAGPWTQYTKTATNGGPWQKFQAAKPGPTFDEVVRPTADDNLALAAKNFQGEQAANRIVAQEYPTGEQLKKWHPTLWQKFRNTDVARRLLGDTPEERADKVELGRTPDIGVLDAVNNPVNPFLPSAETKVGKMLLGYFLAQNAKAAPGDVQDVADKFKASDDRGAWAAILKTGLDATFTGLAAHALATDAITPLGPKAETAAPATPPSEPTPAKTPEVKPASPPAPPAAAPAAPVASAAEIKAAMEGNRLKPTGDSGKPTAKSGTVQTGGTPPPVTPAVKVGDQVFPAQPGETDHNAILARVQPAAGAAVQRGFMSPTGEFVDRTEAAKIVPVPTTVEAGKLHSEDLTKAEPLGLNRPSVQNPALKLLTEKEFDAEFRSARQNVDTAEKQLDAVGDSDELKPEQRKDIGLAQDRWEAASLERFRRNTKDTVPEDLFRELKDIAPKAVQFGRDSTEHQKTQILLEELARQGATPQQMLSEIKLTSPDAAEVFAADLADIKKLAASPRPSPPATGGEGAARQPALIPVEVSPAEIKRAKVTTAAPPDILSTIQDHFPKGVKFDRDQADAVLAAKGAARELMSHTQGEPADQVLQGLHAEGQFKQVETADDLAAAMAAAGEQRIGQRSAPTKAAQALAEQEKRTQLFSQAAFQPRATAETVKGAELFPGDTFQINGRPVRVEEQVVDAETQRPSHLRVSGAYGDQTVGAGDTVHIDKGSLRMAPAGRIEGMGGRIRPNSGKAARTASQAADPEGAPVAKDFQAAVQGQIQSGLAPAATKPEDQWFYGLRKAFNPMSLGEAAKGTATVLRYMLGQRGAAEMKFDHAMAKYRRLFDKNTTPRNFQYDPAQPLPPNWEIQRAIDTGDLEGLTEKEQDFARAARRLLDAAIQRVQTLKPDVLQKLHEFYFPRYWRAEDEAAALKLAQGSRPFEGPKAFLKQRSLQLWDDALKAGLRPRYDNPTDALRAKLGEMEGFASALEAHQHEKAAGRRRFNYIFEKRPDGWTDYHDPSTEVYAPPTVTIQEAYDEQIRTKTRELFQALGIPEERLANIGGKRWGYARETPEEVKTKFGGPDFVFWHEFGHIMDFRYPDLRDTLGLGGSKTTDAELRSLADARLPKDDTGVRTRFSKTRGKVVKGRSAFSSYTRRAEEKMANVFDAYVRAPDLFQQRAPTVYKNLQTWLGKHPEVEGPLNDIRPSLRLGSGETEKFVGGPILLGHWIVPQESANVLNNYLDPGIWGKAKTLRGIKTLGGLISNVRLISAFHGQMVGNDALASGLSLGLNDALKAVAERNPKYLVRGAKEIAMTPARPFMAAVKGHRMLQGLRLSELEQARAGIKDLDVQLGKLAMEANLRAGHANSVDNATRRWSQALSEARMAIKLGTPGQAVPPAVDLFLHAPMAAGELMMKPIMQWFVPRMKLGLMAPMIQRIIADNPDLDEWQIRRQLGKAADSVEDRVGQVTYDNLFQSRVIKDSGQLALQAYGWHLTKERMLWGGASDWAKAGKAMLKGQRPEITFRMTYLPALAITHAIIGASIMYALSGKKPKTLMDYMFPETGLVDAYGKPVRLALADFMKDYLSEWNAAWHGPKAVVEEWERRLMPVWNELADMWRNKDFYNTKIFSERQFDEPEYQHVWTNLKEAAAYVAGSSQPFSLKGAQRFSQSLGPQSTAGQQWLAHFGPYFGFVPAPQALTQSPAEVKAAEIMRDGLPPMSKDQAAHVQAIGQLVHDLRTGKINDEGTFVARARAAGVKDKAELTRIEERVAWTPLEYQINKLPLYEPGTGRDAMTVWDLMSDAEKVATVQIFSDKLQRKYAAGKLDDATTSRLVKVLMPYRKAAAQQAAQAQRPAGGLSALRE